MIQGLLFIQGALKALGQLMGLKGFMRLSCALRRSVECGGMLGLKGYTL